MGWTAYVEPGDDRNIRVRITVCSNKDHFCRKTGREEVMKKEPEIMNARKLGAFLAKHQAPIDYPFHKDKEGNLRYLEGFFAYLYKYMV